MELLVAIPAVTAAILIALAVRRRTNLQEVRVKI